MASPLGLQVGRQRVTVATLPSEAGYVRSIRKQMDVIMKNLLKVIEGVQDATPEAIRFGLQPIFDESQRLVPVDTGRLKRSGYLQVRTEGRSGRVRAEIGYGLAGKPFYAGFVHEILSFKHAAPTQAKFLEAAVNAKIGDFGRRVALSMSGKFIVIGTKGIK